VGAIQFLASGRHRLSYATGAYSIGDCPSVCRQTFQIATPTVFLRCSRNLVQVTIYLPIRKKWNRLSKFWLKNFWRILKLELPGLRL